MNATSASPSAVYWAGAAVTDLTPQRSLFLYGYPHVARDSTGVHDPLQCAALYIGGREGGRALFLANDLIHFTKEITAQVRREISAATGVPEDAIMLTATHTHSGPIIVEHVSNAADSTVPKPDLEYVAWAQKQIIAAGIAAFKAARPAELSLTVARAQGVGTNRHDPAGPADPEVPVLVARASGGAAIAAMVVYGMHPTVLHEDSTLISGDFPHFTRRFLQERVLGASCPVLYHNGASGNQSPRHVTRGNTFAEAQRLGELLGQQIMDALPKATVIRDGRIAVRRKFVPLTMRQMPAHDAAQQALAAAREKFERLRREGAPRAAVRTAECDVFGAEETAELARAAVDGRLAKAAAECSPAEIQVVEIGPWRFVAWPGELFVEYALEVKRRAPGTFIITLANGELQAYIVTAEADARDFYEARNALFSHTNGPTIVDETLALIKAGA